MATMTGDQRELLARIEALVLDRPGASLPFSARLARENGWSARQADRVVAEYRRFVFLAAVAGHPVTPSDEVDQVWHLHLVYTRSYWGELCGEVLGFPLHHGPTVGGPDEGRKFTGWYERTLDSYRRFFGAEPPADIWPPSRQRFADADRYRRVNTADRWILPKPWFVRPGGSRGIRPALAAAGALALTGCLAAAGTNPAILASTSTSTSGDDGGGLGDWVGFGVVVVVAAAIVVAIGLLQRGLVGKDRYPGRQRASGKSGWFGGNSSGCGAGGCGAGGGCGGSGCSGGGGGCGGGGCGS